MMNLSSGYCLTRKCKRRGFVSRKSYFRVVILGRPGETFCMVAHPQVVAPINEQIGNEFSAMLQYYAIAAHFGAEALTELSAHFQKQAEEEKAHALQRAGEGNLLRVEEFLAREKDSRFALSNEE